MISRRHLLLSATALQLAQMRQAAQAQTKFPGRPIVWVVPYPAGGFGDAVSRVLAQHMAVTLGQPVVVENKPGAGGQIAAAYVKQQPADGYTMLYGDIGPFAMNAALYPKLNYDTLRDFQPLTRLLTSSLLLVVPSSSQWRSVGDVLAAAKARAADKAITYGSYGVGSQPHIWMEMLQRETGVPGKMQHVAYKGAAPALQDLMGGHIELMLDVAANSQPYVREGKLRALAVVGSAQRLAGLPQVPTLTELKRPALNASGWTGVVVKVGTSPAIAAQLYEAVVKAVQSDVFRSRFGDMGITPAPQTPQEFSSFIASETQRWGAAIRSAGVTLE